jgi:type III restriction enzyme
VIVARKDDRRDSLTKLSDGAALLEYKAEQAESYCAEHGLSMLNPVMLIVAQNTADANEPAGQRGWISPIGPKPSCGVSM